MTIRKLTVLAAVVVAAGVVAAGVGRFAPPVRAGSRMTAQKEAAAKAADAPAALVKQLEGVEWYLDRYTQAGDGTLTAIDVSDAPARSLSGGLSPDNDIIQFAGPSGPLSLQGLPVSKDAKVTRDGKPAKLTDLRPGWPVTLKFDDKLAVVGIASTTPKPGYVVKAVDAGMRTLTVARGKDSQPMTFAVAEKPYIYLYDKGNEGVLADLAAGMRVTLVAAVVDGKLVVNDIRARK